MKPQILIFIIFLFQINQFAFSSSIDFFSSKSKQEIFDLYKPHPELLRHREGLIRDFVLAETRNEKLKIAVMISDLDAEMVRRSKITGAYLERDPVTGKRHIVGYDPNAWAYIGESRPHPLNISRDYKHLNPNDLDPTEKSLSEINELSKRARKESYRSNSVMFGKVFSVSLFILIVIFLASRKFFKKPNSLNDKIIQPKISSRQAIDSLKLAKEKLDLQLITQQEYDTIKENLAKYID